jgi:molybdate transport system regulatory protein
VIDIGNSDKIASVITVNSIESLGLAVGSKVSAVIKASDVMIGK